MLVRRFLTGYQLNLILRIVRSSLSYYNLISQSSVNFVPQGRIEWMRKRLRCAAPRRTPCIVSSLLVYLYTLCGVFAFPS